MPISPTDFDFVRAMVRKESAIALDPGKEYLVESRLTTLARQLGLVTADQLIEEVRRKPDNGLRYKIVEAMTTNETSFFRDVAPFDALREHVLPDLIARRAAQNSLRIWCGAASTGQEPYSLAMLIREHFPALASWRVEIVATDISREVLDRARTGRYSQLEVNRGLPASMLVKYFEKEGIAWRVKAPLRDMVTFREMNLIGSWTGVDNADIVMMRNVLIYFDVTIKKQILANVRRVLRADGYFMLGSAESTMNIDDKYTRVPVGRTSCYQPLGL
ncbi:MAG: chemotaxis protein CheR [Gemmatimonas sp.]|nr:chemotaxis protein CheR [Gemmatimonas sp.]